MDVTISDFFMSKIIKIIIIDSQVHLKFYCVFSFLVNELYSKYKCNPNFYTFDFRFI